MSPKTARSVILSYILIKLNTLAASDPSDSTTGFVSWLGIVGDPSDSTTGFVSWLFGWLIFDGGLELSISLALTSHSPLSSESVSEMWA